jgi:hypothetical protein
MYHRALTSQDYSFFLFGPRATGESTWLRERYPDALKFNLLLDEDFMQLLGDPALLRHRVEALPAGSWVVVDEVQASALAIEPGARADDSARQSLPLRA